MYVIYLSNTYIRWEFGAPRGGTPALLVNGEYLAFFHSKKRVFKHGTTSKIGTYFMGAYTFSSEPPFMLLRASRVRLHIFCQFVPSFCQFLYVLPIFRYQFSLMTGMKVHGLANRSTFTFTRICMYSHCLHFYKSFKNYK